MAAARVGVCYSAATGNLTAIRASFTGDVHMPYGGGRAYGDPAHARLIAISEAMERYSALVFDERRFVTASAKDLGENALDLDSVARCSARELRGPRLPYHPGRHHRGSALGGGHGASHAA